MSIIEVVLTFALIMGMLFGMLSIVLNYRLKAGISLEKLEMDTFKNTLTKDIQDDILTRGIQTVNYMEEEQCHDVLLNQCVHLVFQDGTSKILGTSMVDENDRNSIENKYIYYDGMKYKLHETIPNTIPEGRKISDFQAIKVQDSEMLSIDSAVLEDGTIINIYAIDIYISHVDFSEDFGIHLVTSTFSEREDDLNRFYLIKNNLDSNFHATNMLGNGFQLTGQDNITNRKVTQEAEKIILYHQNTSSNNSNVTYSSNYAIDLTPYQKMHIKYRVLNKLSNASGISKCLIGFQKEKSNNQTFQASVNQSDATTTLKDTKWVEEDLDISSLSGRYYLSINSLVKTGEITIEISDIWLTQ